MQCWWGFLCFWFCFVLLLLFLSLRRFKPSYLSTLAGFILCSSGTSTGADLAQGGFEAKIMQFQVRYLGTMRTSASQMKYLETQYGANVDFRGSVASD